MLRAPFEAKRNARGLTIGRSTLLRVEIRVKYYTNTGPRIFIIKLSLKYQSKEGNNKFVDDTLRSKNRVHEKYLIRLYGLWLLFEIVEGNRYFYY